VKLGTPYAVRVVSAWVVAVVHRMAWCCAITGMTGLDKVIRQGYTRSKDIRSAR
jgi:hypothetical protein